MDNNNANNQQPQPNADPSNLPPDPVVDGPLNFISDSNQVTGSAASLLGTTEPAPAPTPAETPTPNSLTPPETPAPTSPESAPSASAPEPTQPTQANSAADALVAAANADPGFNMQSGAFGPGQPKKKASPMLAMLVGIILLLAILVAVYFLVLK